MEDFGAGNDIVNFSIVETKDGKIGLVFDKPVKSFVITTKAADDFIRSLRNVIKKVKKNAIGK